MLLIDLPRSSSALTRGDSALDWLLQQLQSAQSHAAAAMTVHLQNAATIDITVAQERGVFTLLSLPLPAVAVETRLEIAPEIFLPPSASPTITQFLRSQWLALDHVGINFSHCDLAEPRWQQMLIELSALLPTYRLNVGSSNDIVLVILENANSPRAAVLELVYDRALARSTVHFCVSIAAERAQLEREFPQPYGIYKPGDEAFFRSVALPFALQMPAYIDFAFKDGNMAPWPQIAQVMGTRIGL